MCQKLVIQPSFRAKVAKHTRNGRHLKTPKIRDNCMAVVVVVVDDDDDDDDDDDVMMMMMMMMMMINY